jgi:hypothetical protein
VSGFVDIKPLKVCGDRIGENEDPSKTFAFFADRALIGDLCVFVG